MRIKPLHACEVQVCEAVISKDACAPQGAIPVLRHLPCKRTCNEQEESSWVTNSNRTEINIIFLVCVNVCDTVLQWLPTGFLRN